MSEHARQRAVNVATGMVAVILSLIILKAFGFGSISIEMVKAVLTAAAGILTAHQVGDLVRPRLGGSSGQQSTDHDSDRDDSTK